MRNFLLCVLAVVLTTCIGDLSAQEKSKPLPEFEMDWQKLEADRQVFYELKPSSTDKDVFEKFLIESCKKAGSLSDRYRKYMDKFSVSEHSEEAWDAWMELLTIAAYRDKTRQIELEQAEVTCLADPKLSKSCRETIRSNQIDRTTDPLECEKMVRLYMHETESPDDFFCWHMLQIAHYSNNEQAKRLLSEILDKSHDVKALSYVREKALKFQDTINLIGKPLDLSFVSLQGQKVDLRNYRGKVVLLHFWATWCSPCVAKLPELKELHKSLRPKGFEIVSITYDNEKAILMNFIQKQNIDWPQYFDQKGMDCPLIQKLRAPGPPAYWLINRDGILVEMGHATELEKRIKELLSEESKH
ncbi:TlpA disulfide reductase family protein [uncultured Rubinisphaera sp.]|uniref:TlpA family protein disulfide reductase n=1 Tax=uncultured Rubinisphaera sp. TaxID=1678686 RepID=UPI0030DD078A|tara:strand:+ start:834 stop:1907 length:1074 start_codon:yes stop_codon:yes gene_type:complete